MSWLRSDSFNIRQTTVHEKTPAPVLYDHKGKPLTRDHRIGFRISDRATAGTNGSKPSMTDGDATTAEGR